MFASPAVWWMPYVLYHINRIFMGGNRTQERGKIWSFSGNQFPTSLFFLGSYLLWFTGVISYKGKSNDAFIVIRMSHESDNFFPFHIILQHKSLVACVMEWKSKVIDWFFIWLSFPAKFAGFECLIGITYFWWFTS